MRPWVLNQLIIVSVFAFLVAHAGPEETSNNVPTATDLQVLALKSNQDKIPILIMYAAEHCEYCERLEEDLLGPMYGSGQYENRVIIRKVMIDSIENIRDFKGAAMDAENFAFKQKVQVTPTLRFVDEEGNQLAPEMVGYNTPEMYAAYIENAIESSNRAIKYRQKK
jgi:thioredoxin-related protein